MAAVKGQLKNVEGVWQSGRTKLTKIEISALEGAPVRENQEE
jgi:hypothetical protein